MSFLNLRIEDGGTAEEISAALLRDPRYINLIAALRQIIGVEPVGELMVRYGTLESLVRALVIYNKAKVDDPGTTAPGLLRGERMIIHRHHSEGDDSLDGE